MNTAPSDLPLAAALSQLVLVHSEPQALLAAAAQCIGRELASEACLLVDATASTALTGFWCARGLGRSRARVLAQLQAARAAPDATAAAAAPLQHLLAVALTDGGALVVGRRAADDWTASERTQLEQVEPAASALLTHAQLQQRLQTYQCYQQLFQDLSRALHNTSALDTLLQVALTGTAQAVSANRSAIITLKYQDPLLAREDEVPHARAAILSQWTAPDVPAFAAAELALADCPYCLTAWQHAPEPLTSLTPPPASPLFAPADGCRRWVIQPLVHAAIPTARPLVLGFLLLQSDRQQPWQAVELEWIAGVGLQVSAAIVRDRALRRVQSVVDDRTAQLKGSLEMQAKLYEKSRQQVEQLRQLLAAKSEFLDAISHELRTPLTAMKMAIQVLRQPDLTPERQTKYLDLLEQEWQREYGLIQDLLALQKLESNQVEVEVRRFNFKDSLYAMLEQFQQKWQDKGLQLEVRYDPTALAAAEKPLLLYSDADSLRQTVQELLTNAGKYSDPETTVRLDIAQAPSRYQLRLSITNWGRGIAPEELDAIFDKFVRGQGVTEQAVPGTGLGLALVKCLVQHLNGTIEVQSQGAAGDRAAETCFTLTLPPPPSST